MLLMPYRYKAHFRWSHYPQIRHASDFDLPNETEACASVTSAFLQVSDCMLQTLLFPSGAIHSLFDQQLYNGLVLLQVLSTLYAAENVRGDRDRNILEVSTALGL